jgi:hypothetical protein
VLQADNTPKKAPVKFGEPVDMGSFPQNGLSQRGGEKDAHFPLIHGRVSTVRQSHQVASSLPGSDYHTVEAMQHFAGPKDHVSNFYCDSAPELIASARACKWGLATATPWMPRTNGVAERSVRTVKEGGGCGSAQSGYNPEWWPEAAEHFASPKT